MKNPKIAVMLGTFFLISSLILPSLAAAQTTQLGTLVVEGTKTIYTYNYGDTAPGVDFADVSAYALDQDSLANYVGQAAGDITWAQHSVGVIDLEGLSDAWNLTVDGPAFLENAAGDQIALGDVRNSNRLEIETTVNKVSGGSIVLTDSDAVDVEFTQDLLGATDDLDMLYWIPDGSTYTWTSGDVTAGLNNAFATDLSRADSYEHGIIASSQTIMTKPATKIVNAAFITQVCYALSVPAAAPGTYTGNITYTLT
ncbi:hypothetical protein KKG22_00520 [Patescibacteria group bacterium]|nr:hypothetical protein [Patescibacteria group bacterium]